MENRQWMLVVRSDFLLSVLEDLFSNRDTSLSMIHVGIPNRNLDNSVGVNDHTSCDILSFDEKRKIKVSG
jgi:hypothetical protein